MTVYDCMTVFWRCLLYRDREKHGTHVLKFIGFELHMCSARGRWHHLLVQAAGLQHLRHGGSQLSSCAHSVPHAMATMHHDDCFPMIAMMNFARCSRTWGVCRQRMPGSRCSALPRGPCSSPWRLAALSSYKDDYIASHEHI